MHESWEAAKEDFKISSEKTLKQPDQDFQQYLKIVSQFFFFFFFMNLSHWIYLKV